MRLKIFLTFILFLNLTLCVFAQDTSKTTNPEVTEIKETTKIDEFGGVSEEEFLSKLKRFDTVLNENQDSQGYVIYYSGYDEPLFRQTTYYIRWKSDEIERYLFKCFRNFRIHFIIGGSRANKTTELWIVPPGAEKPEPKENTELQRELLYKFELLETEYLEFISTNTENPNSDSDLFDYKIKNKLDLEDLLKVSGDVLSKQKHRRAVLIYYLNDKKSDAQTFRDVFEKFIEDNAEKNELDLRRVKIIYGGFRDQAQVESWIIPNDEADPEAMPYLWLK